MNDTIRTILNRRSIRRYRPEPFPDEELAKIVEAGVYAPSSRNLQARHICVVRGQAAIARITAAVKAATARQPDSPYRDSVGSAAYTVNYHAPAFIIVSADPSVTKSPEADAALALGNMFLAARSLGIGSCWINQLNPLCGDAEFRALLTELGVPESYRIYGCGTFGYAEGAYPPAPARKDGRVTYAKI